MGAEIDVRHPPRRPQLLHQSLPGTMVASPGGDAPRVNGRFEISGIMKNANAGTAANCWLSMQRTLATGNTGIAVCLVLLGRSHGGTGTKHLAGRGAVRRAGARRRGAGYGGTALPSRGLERARQWPRRRLARMKWLSSAVSLRRAARPSCSVSAIALGMACIVVTASPSRERRRSTLAGALAYLAGPLRVEALADLVKERRRHTLFPPPKPRYPCEWRKRMGRRCCSWTVTWISSPPLSSSGSSMSC